MTMVKTMTGQYKKGLKINIERNETTTASSQLDLVGVGLRKNSLLRDE
jgi:hypothetical protein